MEPENTFQKSRYNLRSRSSLRTSPKVPKKRVKKPATPISKPIILPTDNDITSADTSINQSRITHIRKKNLQPINVINEKDSSSSNSKSESEHESESPPSSLPSTTDKKLTFIPKKSTRRIFPAVLLFYTMVLALLSYVFWRRGHALEIGYCDGTQSEKNLSYFDFMYPNCWVCPPNATCQGKKAYCNAGYVKVDHPYNSFLYPFPITCLRNSKQEKKVDLLATKAVNLLQRRLGYSLCYSEPKIKELSSDQLFYFLFGNKEASSHDNKSLYQFRLVLNRLELYTDLIEITSLNLGQTELKYYAATTPIFTTRCWIKMKFIDGLIKSYKFILFIAIILGFIFVLRRRYLKYQSEAKGIQKIVKEVIDALIEREHLSIVNPITYPDNSVSVTQLRDLLLIQKYPAINQRIAIWEKVTERIENDTNVRTSQRDQRGDSHKVWEWVGDQPSIFRLSTLEAQAAPFFGSNSPLSSGDDDDGSFSE